MVRSTRDKVEAIWMQTRKLVTTYQSAAIDERKKMTRWGIAAASLFALTATTSNFFKDNALHIAWSVPAFAGLQSLLYYRAARKCYLKVNEIESDFLAKKEAILNRECILVLDSVRRGDNSNLTALSYFFDEGCISADEREQALDMHIWNNRLEAKRCKDHSDEELSDLIYEVNHPESLSDNPDNGYDGWISEDDLPDWR